MPQPITKSIHLEYNPGALRTKPELCANIVVISSMWSSIEDSLSRLFARVSGIEPAVAAAILGNVQSLMIRLQMITTAIDVFVSSDAAAKFRDDLKPRLLKGSSERNRLIHADWRIHPDYPDCLIHTRSLGNPEGRFFKYTAKDFRETEIRLDRLVLDVQQFDLFVQHGMLPRDEERRKYFWRLAESQFDQADPRPGPDPKNDP